MQCAIMDVANSRKCIGVSSNANHSTYTAMCFSADNISITFHPQHIYFLQNNRNHSDFSFFICQHMRQWKYNFFFLKKIYIHLGFCFVFVFVEDTITIIRGVVFFLHPLQNKKKQRWLQLPMIIWCACTPKCLSDVFANFQVRCRQRWRKETR